MDKCIYDGKLLVMRSELKTIMIMQLTLRMMLENVSFISSCEGLASMYFARAHSHS